MDVALIAPSSQLHHCVPRHYQMLIPEALTVSTHIEYERYYKYFGNSKQHYLMMDNGAAEGFDISFGKLLNLAYEYKVDEIVVPDVLRDPCASFALLERFLQFCENNRDVAGIKVPRLMVPIHAYSIQEAVEYISAISALEYFRKRSYAVTIGLPRDLITTIGRTARLELAYILSETHPRFDTHFLGTSREWIEEVLDLAQEHNVRSIDTSAAFIFASTNCMIGEEGPKDRPQNYFDLEAVKFDPEVVKYNVNTFDRWCNQ